MQPVRGRFMSSSGVDPSWEKERGILASGILLASKQQGRSNSLFLPTPFNVTNGMLLHFTADMLMKARLFSLKSFL